jgi:hypothetical protein
MTFNYSGQSRILNQFEDVWKAWATDKAGKQPALVDFLPAGQSEADRDLAWELIKLDLYYRCQAGEPGPLAENYFDLPGFKWNKEQKNDLCEEEKRFRGCMSERFAASAEARRDNEVTLKQGNRPIAAVPPNELRPLEQLGEGGMGVVYRSHDSILGRDVAVKVLKLDLFPGEASRFKKEAHILARLEHPGIVPIHGLGTLEDGRPYFTMKVIQGRTLAELLKERASPAEDLLRYVAIFEQICQTLAYAHTRKEPVLHRDLKPGNVMVGEFGEIQVMDWGLAKLLPQEPSEHGSPQMPEQAAADDATKYGGALGTYPYMSPEQACGQLDQIDRRTDVFGLGAILTEILTGSPPYRAPEVRRKAETADLAETRARLQGCGADPELIDIAQACLAPRAEARPAHAGEVATRVTQYRANVQQRLEEARLEKAKAEEAHARRQAERSRARIRRWAIGLGLGLVAMAMVVFVIYHFWRDAETARDNLATLKEEVEQNAYVHQINLAQSDWHAGQHSRARQLLEKCDEKRRGGNGAISTCSSIKTFRPSRTRTEPSNRSGLVPRACGWFPDKTRVTPCACGTGTPPAARNASFSKAPAAWSSAATAGASRHCKMAA